MKHLLVLVALVGVAGSAVAQTSIPVAGLVAEGEGRWSDALAVYYQHAENAHRTGRVPADPAR